MKRDAKPALQLSSKEIESSIATLRTKHEEAQAAVVAAEKACGDDWRALLDGKESRLREQLTVARDSEDALRLAISAAERDLEEAKAREKLAARLARRDELAAILEQRGQAADELNAALDTVAATMLRYFDGVRASRAITGRLGSRPTEGGVDAGVEEEHFTSLQVLVEIALRDRLPQLWFTSNAAEAQPGPINEALRARGERILAAFDGLADE